MLTGTLSYVCCPSDPDPRVYGPCMSDCDHCGADAGVDAAADGEDSTVIKERSGKFLAVIGVMKIKTFLGINVGRTVAAYSLWKDPGHRSTNH